MMNEPIEIPNKSTFKINEVCALTGVKSYVLRFWESEFSEIAPLVSSSGQKLYEHKDIEAILFIKKLLFVDKFTIEKARAEIKMLMPREFLVEKNFDDFSEEEVANKNFYAHPSESLVQTKRILIESDVQRLVKAKAKLIEILAITEILHQKNHW